MPRASQRHKHETDPSVYTSAQTGNTVQFIGVTYPNTAIRVDLIGDVTGEDSVTVVFDELEYAGAVAISLATAISAITGYLGIGSPSTGVLTVNEEAPNTAVLITRVTITPPQ